jgi:hypothetical protein
MQQIYNLLAYMAPTFIIFETVMLPDYPHKIFSDKRTSYNLLMLALAMDAMR